MINEDLREEFNNYLNQNLHIKAFLTYLEENKINYQILDRVEDSLLILKILTLDPKYFLILLKKSDLKNALINYNNLRYFQKKISEFGDADKKHYLLILDPSMNSFQDIINKSKYVDIQQISMKKEFQRIKDTNVKISIKNELRNGLPLGVYSEKNKLNDLTGKEWIKFTKSWFIHNPPPRKKIEILHPAKFPESLIEEFIKFFTKKDQLVLDPFIGTGSTAVAAKNTLRSCIGFEINEKYVEISKSRLLQKKIDKWMNSSNESHTYRIFHEDSNNLEVIWNKYKLPLADLCITSPPYWNQLKRNFMRQKERKDLGLDTIYSEDPNDIGNIDGYNEFLQAQKKIFDKVYNILKNKAYLVVITNNVFFDGRVYPLAYDTATSLLDKWVLKDEKIWCQDDKTLLPLGINNAWIANRCHQYCLIFRKEQN